jgi:N-acetyl-gamma-glutamyl-phosphate reductase
MYSHAMKVGVIGGTGYLGAELLRLLATHPSLDVAVVQAGSTTSGSSLADLLPGLAGAYGDVEVGGVDPDSLDGLDAVFLAVPSGTSQELVAALLDRTPLVVDLGADFRLKDPALYPQWYGWEHQHPELLGRATYGMPELLRESLRSAQLVAAPGCYVTAATLGLAPLLSAGLIEPTGIIVDAASGTSGAGKSPSAALHHPLVNERFAPYGVLDHRHTPEMEQALGAQLLFTPHLAPMTRGILATSYVRPVPAGGSGSGSASGTNRAPISTDTILDVLHQAYDDEPFVHVTPGLPSTADAYASNVCHLTARYDERTGWVIVISAIDNLVKGGSGQAIQAANVALGLPETDGLPLVGLAP